MPGQLKKPHSLRSTNCAPSTEEDKRDRPDAATLSFRNLLMPRTTAAALARSSRIFASSPCSHTGSFFLSSQSCSRERGASASLRVVLLRDLLEGAGSRIGAYSSPLGSVVMEVVVECA